MAKVGKAAMRGSFLAAVLAGAAAVIGAAPSAWGHGGASVQVRTQVTIPAESLPTPPAPPAEYAGPGPETYAGVAYPPDSQGTAPVPPNIEGTPVAAENGYCYAGAHPVDLRHETGAAWDPSPGVHVHAYAPIDLRLFALHDGCYYFVGDPRDFGYAGQTYSYYGAHPVLAAHGGGWCFMMGGHTHLWAPWSPYFTVVGPWYYWRGPYDSYFWTYWPYYSRFYRQYYPHYYGGGRFLRGGGSVAPRIGHVPAPAWRGARPGSNGSRGAPGIPNGGGHGASPGTPNRALPPAASRGFPSAPARGAPLAPVTVPYRGGQGPNTPRTRSWGVPRSPSRGVAAPHRGGGAPAPAGGMRGHRH